MGATGNPQQAAILIGIALPVAGYFLARPAENKLFRILAGVTAGFLVIFLMWTGSRTGMLMAAVGVALTFRARIGRLVGVGIVVGIFGLMAFQIYSESTMSIGGMFERGNTRSRVWSALWDTFVSSPITGDMSYGYGVGENSYLAAAANNGLLGLVPLGAFLLFTLASFFKLHRARRLLGTEKPFVDLIIGGFAGMLVGAMFEGYLLGTLTYPVFVIYCYLALTAFGLDAEQILRYQAEYGGELPLEHDDQPGMIPQPVYAGQQYF
jgi:O-antigen ligase